MSRPLLLLIIAPAVLALENKWGVGRLPALGWNSWNAYRCSITEAQFLSAAEKMVSLGLKDAGYEYVNIDDCWSIKEGRSNITGRIQVDLTKFPSGIDGLAKKIHDMGLKIGIYSSAGEVTCQKYPASLGHEEIDVKTWSDMGIDYLKYDNCGVPPAQLDECKYCLQLNATGDMCKVAKIEEWETTDQIPREVRYCPQGYDYNKSATYQRFTRMRDAVAKSERPILFSLCQWGQANVNTWGNATGQSWRTTEDIRPFWKSVKQILNNHSFTLNYVNFWGHGDADMLEVGNGGLSLAEERTHFSLWAAMKSPLLIGTDLAKLRPESVEILKNKYLLAFNQDNVVGEPAKPYKWGTNPNWTFNDTFPAEYWSGNSQQGVLTLVINTGESSMVKRVDFAEVPELKANGTYRAFNVWSERDEGCFTGGIDRTIDAHDTSVLILKEGCTGA
ncbi:hypothetical protein FKW77_008431 [Venturia effusa]|uniref:Alpha-galactosidase n=1 Tax=Venturia effusa TaxID=50376 RepID=A0A517LCR6_9PEZI|nr:hypothetical protein FKW77_008431 [Venturia effusa]